MKRLIKSTINPDTVRYIAEYMLDSMDTIRVGMVTKLDFDTIPDYDDCVNEGYCWEDDPDNIDEYNMALEKIQSINADMELYDGKIQLSNNHTMHQIERECGIDEINEALTIVIDDFEYRTGVEVYMEGRSGRHICVPLTLDNALKYDELVQVQRECEQNFISMLNKGLYVDA